MPSLDTYLRELRDNALILEYTEDEQLAAHVEAILVQAVTRDQARAELQLETSAVEATTRFADIWPRVEVSERLDTDPRGQLRTRRTWYLVLHNTGSGPAQSVHFHLDDSNDGSVWRVISEAEEGEPDVAVLAPGGEAKFLIVASMGSAPQTLCTVTWTDDQGTHENSATLRLT